jgi:hypothetical protein
MTINKQHAAALATTIIIQFDNAKSSTAYKNFKNFESIQHFLVVHTVGGVNEDVSLVEIIVVDGNVVVSDNIDDDEIALEVNVVDDVDNVSCDDVEDVNNDVDCRVDDVDLLVVFLLRQSLQKH